MSLPWIREHYGVPAYVERQIVFAGAPAVITGTSGPHLRARMLGTCRWAEEGAEVLLHPTWEVEYPEPSP